MVASSSGSAVLGHPVGAAARYAAAGSGVLAACLMLLLMTVEDNLLDIFLITVLSFCGQAFGVVILDDEIAPVTAWQDAALGTLFLGYVVAIGVGVYALVKLVRLSGNDTPDENPPDDDPENPENPMGDPVVERRVQEARPVVCPGGLVMIAVKRPPPQ
jgi:hypothetical protein